MKNCPAKTNILLASISSTRKRVDFIPLPWCPVLLWHSVRALAAESVTYTLREDRKKLVLEKEKQMMISMD